MIDAPYERILITVNYGCGCCKARFVFRTPGTETQARTRDDYHFCDSCSGRERKERDQRLEAATRAAEARAVAQAESQRAKRKRYLVEGKSMSVTQRKDGMWRGQCKVQGQTIQHYFGRRDPRPLLQEVEL